jgi:hypothetical protein
LATDDKRIRDICSNYIQVISPLVLQYEVLGNTFPTEILNEIRAVFTHFAKYTLSDDPTIKAKNLTKAEGHIKRSILDCYKYLCMTYEDVYTKFDKRYKSTDLSFVDNGEFLPKLLKARKNAVALLIDARKSDLTIDSDDEVKTDEAYEKYEKAFDAYSKVYTLITDSYTKLENLRRKMITKITISYAISFLSLLFAILKFIFG